MCFYGPRRKSRSIKTQKNNEANIQQSLTEQAWPIKDLINSQKTLFLAGPTQKIPGGKGEVLLVRSGSCQSKQRIRFILPAREFSHKIN